MHSGNALSVKDAILFGRILLVPTFKSDTLKCCLVFGAELKSPDILLLKETYIAYKVDILLPLFIIFLTACQHKVNNKKHTKLHKTHFF